MLLSLKIKKKLIEDKTLSQKEERYLVMFYSYLGGFFISDSAYVFEQLKV